MIRIQAERRTLVPRRVFRTARVSRGQVENVFVALEQDGVSGLGEASALAGDEPRAAVMALEALGDRLRGERVGSVDDLRRLWTELRAEGALSNACLCAVDVALWDLLGKLTGKTACEIALGKLPQRVVTSVTLGLGPREEWPERIGEVAGYPSIKVKLDASVDLDILRAIRERSQARLRVDANGSWSGKDLGVLSAELEALGVELIEQPLPADEDENMPALLRVCRLPVIADESCRSPEDVAKLPGRFTGFNIKLVKCGGITPALQMLGLGRRAGLEIMVGCMLESSLLISAGLLVAQDAHYADLDGSWLLREDPFQGPSLKQGNLNPGPGWGLGVSASSPPPRS